MENCIDKWQRIKESATTTEKKIIEYLLENPLALQSLSIEKLAEKSGTSYASVERFCRKMKFSGFKEMKKVFARELESDYYKSSQSDASPEKGFDIIIDDVCSFYGRILEDFRISQTEEKLKAASLSVVRAKSIFFIGQGTSSISAKYGYIKFLRLGISCSVDSDSTTLKARATVLSPGDLLFAVSSSGRTKPVVDAAVAAKKSGAKVICLCDYAESPLAAKSDIVLSTTMRNVANHLQEDMPLTVGQIAIIDTLWTACLSELRLKAKESLSKTQSQVSSEKV